MKGVLLGFGLGYLALCLGVASGATLPGDHNPIHRVLAASTSESLEASYDCGSRNVTVTVHDGESTLRRLGAGIVTFTKGGIAYDRENWTFNTGEASSDQVIARLAPGLMAGDWTVTVDEASSLSAPFKVADCPTLPNSPNPPNPANSATPGRPPTGTWGLG